MIGRALVKEQLKNPCREVDLNPFRVWFHIFSTRFECGFTSSPLVSSVFSHLLHSFRVYFSIFSTRFECGFTSSPLVSSVVFHLLHSFRVWFYVFSTRFECSFRSFPLVPSVGFWSSTVEVFFWQLGWPFVQYQFGLRGLIGQFQNKRNDTRMIFTRYKNTFMETYSRIGLLRSY